jgi:hypothetical protein
MIRMNRSRAVRVGSRMKFATILAAFLLITPVFAEDTKPDLTALKPVDQRSIRVLLYIPGGPRLIDYSDVCKVVSCDEHCILFETHDGTTITHRGGYTIIQPRNLVPERTQRRLSPGPQFYESK